MPTALGEYCIRCGKKCVVEDDEVQQAKVWRCPDHGIQKLEAFGEQEKAQEEQSAHVGVEDSGGQQQ